MAYKSPSVRIREIDKSSYTTTSSNTVLAIVGYATKGPIGQPVLVTSLNEFIEKFGTIPESSPYGHLAAYRAFNQTNQIIYYRVADDTATAAEYVVLNTTEAAAAYQEFVATSPVANLSGGTSYSFNLTVDDASSSTEFTITSPAETGDWLLSDIASAIDTALTDGTAGATCAVVDGQIRITSDTVGTVSEILIETGSTGEDLVELLGGVEDPVATTTEVLASETDNIQFIAKEKGSATNNITVTKSSNTDPVSGDTINTIEVSYDGSVVETFEDVSLSYADDNFFETVINKDSENGGSEYITVEIDELAGADTVVLPDMAFTLGSGEDEFATDDTVGDYDHIVGTDGIPSAGGSYLFVEALSASGALANDELYNFHILVTPDSISEATQNAAISLANSDSRKDFIYIADPPFALEYDEVTNWHNGSGHGRSNALNDSYTATYWPYLKEYNTQSREYVWVPPSVYIAELYLTVDNNFGPWFAPAGDVRGRLITSDLETSPSFSQREVLYGDPNAVNPIVDFVSKGITVFGQKTTYRVNSAVNRISVRRTLIYIKKLIKKSAQSMIFEPHTEDSWNRAANAIANILETVRANGGLEAYTVQIDSNTNTENLIAQGIMRGVITVVPVGTIERIELDLKFLNPGASITETTA